MSPFTPSLLLLLPELAHDGVGCPPCNNPDMYEEDADDVHTENSTISSDMKIAS